MNFKHLSVVILLAGLAGCNYPSRQQALDACYEWKQKGEKITYSYQNFDVGSNHQVTMFDESITVNNRDCKSEDATNQILGYEGKWSEKDRAMSGASSKSNGGLGQSPKAKDSKVVKHFRY